MTQLTAGHFYHCWVDGEWQIAADEHIVALRDSGFRADTICVGLVGSRSAREAAAGYLLPRLHPFGPASVAVETDEGYEQITLAALRDWARFRTDTAVLYAHTKGAMNVSAITAEHRQVMTRKTVYGWRAALAALEQNDAAGCFWDGPACPRFLGNFWWATAAYLGALPEPGTATRHDAEGWIGLGAPRVCELNPEYTYSEMVRQTYGETEPGGIPIQPGASDFSQPTGKTINGAATGASIPGCR